MQYREVDMRALERAQADALDDVSRTPRSAPLAQRVQPLAVPAGVDREAHVLAVFQRALASVDAAEGILVKAQIARDVMAFRSVVSAYKLSLEVEMRAAEASVLCMRSLGRALLDEYPGDTSKARGEKTGLGTYTCLHAVSVAQPTDDVLDEVIVWLKAHATLPSIGKVIRALRRHAKFGSLDRAEKERPLNPRYGGAGTHASRVIYPTTVASCKRAIERIETVIDVATDEATEVGCKGCEESRPFADDERHFFETLIRYMRLHEGFTAATSQRL